MSSLGARSPFIPASNKESKLISFNFFDLKVVLTIFNFPENSGSKIAKVVYPNLQILKTSLLLHKKNSLEEKLPVIPLENQKI